MRNSLATLDPDLGWHLKVGEEISRSGLVPHINIYNFSYIDKWVDHEWLINFISFKIFNNLGYLSLSIIFSLVIILTLILLTVFTRRFYKKIPEWLIALVQIFGLLACLAHFGVRMQEFSFLFLLLELFIISEFNQTRSAKVLFWLLPLFYLWANIHGAFPLGLAVLLMWPVSKFIEKKLYLSRYSKLFDGSRLLNIKDTKIFLCFSLLAFLATLATPYRLELYSFLSGYRNTFYLSTIQEWLSQLNFPFQYAQLLYLAISFLGFSLYIYKVVKEREEKLDVWQIALFFAFFFLAFRSRRHFPLFFIATFPYLISQLTVIFELNKTSFSFRKELKYLTILCLGLAILKIGASLNYEAIKIPFNNYCNKYPCAALDFIKQDSAYQDLNIFNDYDWGGFLIWTYPEGRLFIDGRLPQAAYAGHTLMEEYADFFRAETEYELKLNRYDVRLVMLKTASTKQRPKKWEELIFWLPKEGQRQANHLKDYLDSSKNWNKIFSDQVATIYLRK